MSNVVRDYLYAFFEDPCQETLDAVRYVLRRIQPRDEHSRAWLAQLDFVTPTERKMWALRGLRLWDMGLLVLQDEKLPVMASKPAVLPPQNWRDLWSVPVRSLKGCGPATARALNAAGIYTIADLLFLFPRHYVDLRLITPVVHAEEKRTQLFALTVDRVRRIGRKCFVDAHDTSGTIHLMWFSMVPGLLQLLQPGHVVYAVGEIHFYNRRRQLVHPRISASQPAGIRVIYPTVEGVGEGMIARFIAQALNCIPSTPTLPVDLETRYQLWPLPNALRFLHQPPADISLIDLQALENGTHPAQKRLLFEEVFLLQCAIGKHSGVGLLEEACRVAENHMQEFAQVFSFTLTSAQQRVVDQILQDMSTGRPMRRLLQGDVGSGKTAVAFLVAAHVIEIGRQVAVMAPTTILASQLYRTLFAWCEHFGWPCALLTADTPAGARESILALLEAGHIHVLVGTHSLLAQRIEFANLGLVIVDEQHRFGVEQRAQLVSKGNIGERPHLLVMSATPIPRSLALTVYGDLEHSRIDELPPGRPMVVTKACFTKTQKKQALAQFMDVVSKGEKGFVIVPLIDVAEERVSIETTLDYLGRQYPHLALGVVHGRMPARERQDVLDAFAVGRIQVLVATTVVEVGMDVPDANYMIILEADRFGLAQLHQLRGRIGRRSAQGAQCWLFAGTSPTSEGRQRLQWMEKTRNGFELAEADLSMRGPGDVLGGKRQSGVFKPVWIRNVELLQAARFEARQLLVADPQLTSHPDLHFLISVRFGDKLFDESGG